jgi:hypothetical protein
MHCGTHLALQYCDTTAMFHVLLVTTASICSNVNITAMLKVLQVLQHHSNIQRTAGRNSTAVLQHHGTVQCTAGHTCSHLSTATSQQCSKYYRYCNITAMFNVLHVLQHHSHVQSNADIPTSQQCSIYCRSQMHTAMCSIYCRSGPS